MATTKKSGETNALKPYRVPLVGTMQNRDGTANKDQRFINCFAESRKNDITETKKIYLYQRPGLVARTTVSASTIGRGCKSWNGKIYSVFGNKLFSDTTEIQTLTTSTGLCSFEVGTTEDKDVLVLADGVYVYVITNTNTVTVVPLTLSNWAASTAYTLGQRVKPTTANGFYYEVVVAGTSAGTQPTWPVYLGETKTDGGVTWVAKGYTNDAGTWLTSHAYQIGDRVSVTVGASNYLFECYTAGTSGTSAPVWSIVAGNYVTDNTAIWVSLGEFLDDAAPKYHQPSLVFLDGYLFLALKRADGSETADMYNSDLDNPYSWNPTNFISAEQFPDKLKALARQNNMIVAFGETSTEFYYDAGTVSGSPLARNTSYTLQVGIAAPRAIYQNEKFCAFIGQSASGGRAVWMLDGFVPKKVSDEFVEKILDAEGASIDDATGYGVRTNGHLFYVINLTNTTLVYDLEEKLWHSWSGVSCVAMAEDGLGKAILQHKTNGKLYYLDTTVGTDDGTPITMEVYTTKMDFESMNNKSMQSLYLVGDLLEDKTIDIRWSDDDYNTWSTWRVLDLYPRAYYASLGSFRRRAFHLKYTGGVPLRLEAFEFDVRLWKA